MRAGADAAAVGGGALPAEALDAIGGAGGATRRATPSTSLRGAPVFVAVADALATGPEAEAMGGWSSAIGGVTLAVGTAPASTCTSAIDTDAAGPDPMETSRRTQ